MSNVVEAIASHLKRVMTAEVDRLAPESAAMWPAAIDTRTGRMPAGEHVPRRVYRLIGAPRGSTLYWDQPSVVAAYAMSRLTGDAAFAAAADRYVQAFMARCVDDAGMFQWGNHQYYDLFENKVIAFTNGYHELRPITPAWDVFWRHDAAMTERYIRTMVNRHVYDPVTGGFDRHDRNKREHAFLEAGAILVESLAWLHGKTGDDSLREQALRVARYSYGHRGETTGLVRNEPDLGRWDAKVSTTEVGLWSQSLLRAARYSGCEEFSAMAGSAARAWIERGFDAASGLYFGQLSVADGKPVVAEKLGYWPRRYADVWNTDQWPNHDYPMALAEACLTMHAMTGEAVYVEAVRRWARIAMETRPVRSGRWTYAENYGRCIHFLVHAGMTLDDSALIADAQVVAKEAMGSLYENGLFQGFPGEHLYEAVDGVGFLLLGLLMLETHREVDLMGFGF